MRQHVDLMIAGGTVVTQNPRREVIGEGAVAVSGSSLVEESPSATIRTTFVKGRAALTTKSPRGETAWGPCCTSIARAGASSSALHTSTDCL